VRVLDSGRGHHGLVRVHAAMSKKVVRLKLAILPDKRVKCCCTPETCICKKPVDKPSGSGKVKG